MSKKLAWGIIGTGAIARTLADLRTAAGARALGSEAWIKELRAAESERRVTAYTGLTPSGSLPEPEGISRRDWVAANISSMRALLDPVLERAGSGPGGATRLPVLSSQAPLVLRRTAEAGSRELLTVAAQDEFVTPSRMFTSEPC